MDWLIESFFYTGYARSSDDVSSLSLTSINRSPMLEILRCLSSLNSYIGICEEKLIKNGKRALLILKIHNKISIEETVSRKNGFKSSVEVIFNLFNGENPTIYNFLVFSKRKYFHLKIDYEDFLIGESPFLLFKIRTSSKSNINLTTHGLSGAITLSQTPIKIDKDSVDIVRKELLIDLENVLKKHKDLIDLESSQIFSSNLS